LKKKKVKSTVPRAKLDTADTRPLIETKPKSSMEDDRPTEIHETLSTPDLITSREQIITGFTIGEMIKNSKHKLSRVLAQLVDKARADLKGAKVDARSSLLLRHDFEFDRRTGYRLKLKLFASNDRCVEVTADVDQDGRAIRRGSLISKLIDI
jgi:hypothetical protein